MKDQSIIYKYRNWDDPNQKDVLLNNELFFASPGEINDPFDFQATPDLRLLDSNDKRIQFINKMLDDYIDMYKILGKNVEDIKRNLSREMSNSIEKIQDEYDAVNRNWTNNRFGIISFSYRWDSILMWSHYSNNHKGFCVGFNKEKILNCGQIGSAGLVNYLDEFPSIDPIGSDQIKEITLKTHTKARDWKYEEEYRVTNLWDTTPSIDDRKLRFSEDFIEEIFLGFSIDDASKSEISKIAVKKNIPLYQIIKKKRTYLLDRIKLM